MATGLGDIDGVVLDVLGEVLVDGVELTVLGEVLVDGVVLTVLGEVLVDVGVLVGLGDCNSRLETEGCLQHFLAEEWVAIFLEISYQTGFYDNV